VQSVLLDPTQLPAFDDPHAAALAIATAQAKTRPPYVTALMLEF
jgi:hypothetical protein